MQLPFVKMQAQGNDFVILDGTETTLPELSHDAVLKICNRHLGVGCDQLLVLQHHAQADVLMLIYNADGSMAANCGNGLRCVAFLMMEKLGKQEVSIALADRTATAQLTNHGVRVNIGEGIIEKETETFTDVHMGNAHRVYFQDAQLCEKRNVEIISSYDAHQASITIIERGAGATLACGSGACATAVAVWQKTGRSDPLTIHMPGGDVFVSQLNGQLYLEGKVSFVFEGLYTI